MGAVTRRWKFRANAANIHRIDIQLDRIGDEQRVLLQSDVHWDNPHCDWETLTRHLDEAKRYDAPVIDNGDWFCAMQGKWDKRANKNDLRPEHQKADYLDQLVATSAAFLKPYKDILTVRGMGNHETSILKHHETNLTERLTERLKVAGAPHVHASGYSGFVVFVVRIGTGEYPVKLYYHHGYGGGGAVTRGVIQTNRQAVYLADADIVFSGHTHDSWQVPIARIRLNQDCTAIRHTRQTHVRVAGYKEEYRQGLGGWHVERGGPPKPVGAAWLVFRVLPCNGTRRTSVDYDIIEAK